MRAILVTLIAALSMTAALTVAPGASASVVPCAIDENGNCISDDYASVYADDEAWESDYQNFGGGSCKTVHAARTIRNWAWVWLYKLVEQVYFCWNGRDVTTFTRWRWPEVNSWIPVYSFDGFTLNSCTSEYCSEQIMDFYEHASTQAQFHNCVIFCSYRYPKVDIGVNAYGQWAYHTSG